MGPASWDRTPGNKIAVGIDLQNQSDFAGFYDLPISQQVMQPLPDLTAVNPVWAGSTAGYNGAIQVYMNADQVSASCLGPKMGGELPASQSIGGERAGIPVGPGRNRYSYSRVGHKPGI